MPTTTHYDVLEVSPKASAEVIRAAYKSLMQRHHPDKHVEPSGSTPRAVSIAQAYEVLGSSERRLAYDQFLNAPLAAQATPTQRERSVQRLSRKPETSPRYQAWYAGALIVCILGAGGVILLLSGKTGPAERLAQANKSLFPQSTNQNTGQSPSGDQPQVAGTLPASDTRESLVALQARTISVFVSDLSIELTAPGASPVGTVHMLHIPTIGLRLPPKDAERWVQKLNANRQELIEELLRSLASAEYLKLLQTDGDLYLKQLIATTLRPRIGLEMSAQARPTEPTQTPQLTLEVLLPLSYSVR